MRACVLIDVRTISCGTRWCSEVACLVAMLRSVGGGAQPEEVAIMAISIALPWSDAYAQKSISSRRRRRRRSSSNIVFVVVVILVVVVVFEFGRAPARSFAQRVHSFKAVYVMAASSLAPCADARFAAATKPSRASHRLAVGSRATCVARTCVSCAASTLPCAASDAMARTHAQRNALVVTTSAAPAGSTTMADPDSERRGFLRPPRGPHGRIRSRITVQ